MLRNNSEKIDRHVKFIDYTGRYPNLCSGVLTLDIDGAEYKFGHDYRRYDWNMGRHADDNFDSFWSSGGSVSFTSDWDAVVEDGEWIIDVNEMLEQFRKYAAEIDEVFNDNVRCGCCGGCV